MTPLRAFLLGFGMAALIGIGVILKFTPKQLPAAPSKPPVVVSLPTPVAPAVPARKPKLHHVRQTTSVAAKKQPTEPLFRNTYPPTDGQQGTIFSGVDPVDPRIYHFAGN